MSLTQNTNTRQVPAKEMFKIGSLAYILWSNCYLAIAIALPSYVALVGLLRYRRMAKIESPFGPGRKDLSEMTVKEAHEILTELQELEFPSALAKARKIALLKV